MFVYVYVCVCVCVCAHTYILDVKWAPASPCFVPQWLSLPIKIYLYICICTGISDNFPHLRLAGAAGEFVVCAPDLRRDQD